MPPAFDFTLVPQKFNKLGKNSTTKTQKKPSRKETNSK